MPWSDVNTRELIAERKRLFTLAWWAFERDDAEWLEREAKIRRLRPYKVLRELVAEFVASPRELVEERPLQMVTYRADLLREHYSVCKEWARARGITWATFVRRLIATRRNDEEQISQGKEVGDVEARRVA
jgi:hypothetical protein